MNISVLFMALAFSVIETAYFGWNLTPQSDAEMICDGIAGVIFALSFVTGSRN